MVDKFPFLSDMSLSMQPTKYCVCRWASGRADNKLQSFIFDDCVENDIQELLKMLQRLLISAAVKPHTYGFYSLSMKRDLVRLLFKTFTAQTLES